MPADVLEPKSLLPVADAQARLFALLPPLPVETVTLSNAVGRWAAEDVIARRTQPGSDLSSMDGYAIRYAERPGPWKVIGESAAGASLGKALQAGEAARIFTGATMPEGADCVLVQEEAGRDGDVLTMTGDGPAQVGAHVRFRGVDFREADILCAAGERLDARHVALAAIGGHGALRVRRRPRVALISTGDELVPPGAKLEKDQLPASNAVMLAAFLAGWPAIVEDRGIIRDDLEAIAQAFTQAEADIIVTTGGASVGDRDLIRPALEKAGATLDFWRIAMRPGKPLLAGKLGNAVVLGLPGNPVSSYVTACLFLLPMIAHLGGAADPLPRTSEVALGAPLPANGVRQDYLRARIEDGHAFAPGGQDSSYLATLARADCLLIRPANAPAARTGDRVQMLDLRCL